MTRDEHVQTNFRGQLTFSSETVGKQNLKSAKCKREQVDLTNLECYGFQTKSLFSRTTLNSGLKASCLVSKFWAGEQILKWVPEKITRSTLQSSYRISMNVVIRYGALS